MPTTSSSLPRLSRRRALAMAVLPLGALALLSACGGTAAATASTTAAPPATTSSAPPVTSAASTVASTSATSLGSTAASSQATTTSTASPSVTSAAQPTAQPAAAAPARAGNAVVFWSNAGYPYKDQIGAQLVQEFQQQGGPSIAYTDTTYGDFMKKLLTTVAAGTPPDLSYVDRYVTQSYASRGVLSAMDAMIGTSKVIKKDSFFPLLVHDTNYHGKTYGIPHGPDVGLLYYNKDLFHAMGLDPEKPPTDWETANTIAQQLTRKDGDNYSQIGWSPAQDWGVPWMVAYWQQGGQLLNADETKATFDNAQAVAALDFLKKTYDLEGSYDAVTKFVSSVASGDAEKAFMASKVAMRWDTHSAIHTFDVNKVNFQWGASYFPLPQGGHHANYMGGWSLAIPTGAKQAAGAFQFLEFLCTPDPQVRWAEAWNCLPSVVAVAQSQAYIKGDQVRQLAVNEMPTAQWVIAAPGGDQIISVEVGIMGTVLSGKQSAHDALTAANAKTQSLLDEAYKNSTVP